MVKKYYKVRGRPPVLMEEEEYNKIIKQQSAVKKPKSQAAIAGKTKEIKEDGN